MKNNFEFVKEKVGTVTAWFDNFGLTFRKAGTKSRKEICVPITPVKVKGLIISYDLSKSNPQKNSKYFKGSVPTVKQRAFFLENIERYIQTNDVEKYAVFLETRIGHNLTIHVQFQSEIETTPFQLEIEWTFQFEEKEELKWIRPVSIVEETEESFLKLVTFYQSNTVPVEPRIIASKNFF